ncbi:head GIN domain-containing protein [Flavobacterium sp. SUN046]|uniref:head GIN domain-containing protein n=1 Tax=Flavobacterium sp. SUN046 TaxID=3002440 RepID=UPI002DB868DE|nr:head GIN domain-containing protein [Flavobacterium sp. SUN046]MEC4048551.1 head GIN domain-containing protein [Flavobacterium sp. SUN046]
MNRIIILITTLLLSLISFAQVSENRNLDFFSKLKVSQGIKLHFSIDNTQSIRVETDNSEKLQYIKTVVEGSTLKVFVDSKDYSSKKHKKDNYFNLNFKVLNVYITAPEVNDFEASSSASISIENKIVTKNCAIKAHSSGTIIGDFNADAISVELSSSAKFTSVLTTNELNLKISSSGTAKLSGTAATAIIRASSSGDCLAKNLSVDKATIDASSSATVYININNSITAQASSSAKIFYNGNPTNVIQDSSSSGKIIKE